MDRGAVAEDDDLTGVFRHLKSAPMDFTHEPVHPREPLHIPRLAPYHATLLDGFGREKVIQPDLGRERGVAVLHMLQSGGCKVKVKLMEQLEGHLETGAKAFANFSSVSA